MCLPAAFTSFTGKAHWEHLIKSRAIENLVYFAASAQGGYHVCGRETYGNSIIVNPWYVVHKNNEYIAKFCTRSYAKFD